MKHSMVPGRKLWFLLALALVLVSLSAIGVGQELQAALTGTVTDPSGAVIGGARCMAFLRFLKFIPYRSHNGKSAVPASGCHVRPSSIQVQRPSKLELAALTLTRHHRAPHKKPTLLTSASVK